MKYFHILFAGIIIEIESRSLSSSTIEDELKVPEWGSRVNQIDGLTEENYMNYKKSSSYPEELRYFTVSQSAKQIEKVFADFAEKISALNAITDNGQSEDISGEQSILEAVKNLENVDNPTKSTIPTSFQKNLENTNLLKDLIDSAEELDIYYQDSQDDGRHVKSRYEDSSAMFPVIQQEIRNFDIETSNEIIENNKNEENDAEELDAMLIDLRSQINRMRNNLRKLCRNKHSASLSNTKSAGGDSKNQLH